MTGIIFTNGHYGDRDFYRDLIKTHKGATIIASDGGARFLDQIDVLPDIMLGDMDSVPKKLLERYRAYGIPEERHPVRKDETDTELAVTWCLKQRIKKILLCGATGSRIDHSYSNLFLLNRLLAEGVEAKILDPVNEVFLVKDRCILKEKIGTTVSVLSFTDESTGINLRGFEYPVKNGRMAHFLAGYGVSNVTMAEEAEISVASGILLVDIVRKTD